MGLISGVGRALTASPGKTALMAAGIGTMAALDNMDASRVAMDMIDVAATGRTDTDMAFLGREVGIMEPFVSRAPAIGGPIRDFQAIRHASVTPKYEIGGTISYDDYRLRPDVAPESLYNPATARPSMSRRMGPSVSGDLVLGAHNMRRGW